MPSGIYKRPQPDAGVLERSLKEGHVSIAPDKEELKDYIKKRLKESNVSSYALAKNLGKQRGALSAPLQPGISISYDMLERLLWIVDGDKCPYAYNKGNEQSGWIEPSDFQIKHPSAFVVDYLQDEWKVVIEGKVYIYDKINWSLKGALNDLDSKL